MGFRLVRFRARRGYCNTATSAGTRSAVSSRYVDKLIVCVPFVLLANCCGGANDNMPFWSIGA